MYLTAQSIYRKFIYYTILYSMLCRTNVEELRCGKGELNWNKSQTDKTLRDSLSSGLSTINCGIGAVVNINGIKLNDTVVNALYHSSRNPEHRAGVC